MSSLKIVFIAGEKQTVLYAQGMKQMWQVESHVLERLGQAERQALAEAQFRKYWIDEENDRVDIINDADFDFFMKRSHSQKTPKIYFEARVPPKETVTTGQRENEQQTKPNQDNLSIHPTVECDVCLKAPIRGYRYKCLQCPNFDLCMKCESEMKHTEHLMLRIPHPDSAKLETVCPITSIFGKTARRQQKHAARAAASANAAAEGSGGDGKSRHHRHHRKHCSGGAGLLSNFYDMMQDLAEGGVPQENPETPQRQAQREGSAPPQLEKPFEAVLAAAKVAAATAAKEASTAAASAAAAAAASSAASASATSSMSSSHTHTSSMSASASGGMPKETNTTFTAGAQTTPNGSIPVTPSLENLIDPQFMKAGIQILNNFSEMFGKILDPVITEGGSRSSSAPESVQINIDLTGENGASGTPPPTAAETPNIPAGSNQTSNAGSGIITPMETETAPAVQAPERETSQPRSRNSQSEENDWTMIDSNIVTVSDVPSADPTTAPAAPIDFAKLSQQLQSHIENEMKSVSFEIPSPVASLTPPKVAAPAVVPNVASIPAPAPVAAPAAAPTPTSAPAAAPVAPPVAAPVAAPVAQAPEITERRAIAVFHADPRINSAVHGMMAMGFSNEGAVLTQLLESVNGSIPLALDLMSAAQRN